MTLASFMHFDSFFFIFSFLITMKERTVQKRFDDDYKLNELLVNDFMIKLTDFFSCVCGWMARKSFVEKPAYKAANNL